MADRTLRFNILARDQNTQRTLNQIADAAEGASDEFGDMARAARKLDGDIEGLEREILKLKVAMAGAGDDDLFKDMDRQLRGLEQRLGRRLNVRKAFADAGSDGAEQMSASFVQRIGPLLLRAPVSAPLIAGAVGAAPVISSTIAAAVTGGVALAGVGAGLAIAFRDPAVKAEAHVAAADIGEIFKDAAKPFVPEAIKSIGIVRAEIRKLKPEFDAIFATSAGYSDTLAGSLGAAIDELVPDLRQVVQNAEPVVNVLGEHLPKAASTSGDALKILSSDSKTAADALDGLLTSTEFLIGGTAQTIAWMNKLGPAVASPLYILGALNEETKKNNDELHNAVSWSGQAAQGYEFTAEQLAKMTDEQRAAAEAQMASTAAARQAVDAYRTLSEQMRDAADANQSYLGAAISMEAAIDEATAAVKENGKTVRNHGAALDLNTAKGRANAAALNALAASTLNARDKVIALKGSQGEANAVMERGRQKFIEAAVAAGLTRTAAARLATQLGLLPPGKSIPITAPGLSSAISGAAELKRKIDALHSKSIRIDTHYFYTSSGDFHVPDGTITQRAHGGPVQAGRPYIVGERRPELFVPDRNGTILPSVPSGGADADTLARAIRAALAGVTVTMDGRAVGRMQARTADLYARGD